MVVVWPRTCRLQSASPVMMFVCGIKASLTSSRCAARLVIAFKTVLLVVSDVVAVSLGIWLASVSPFNRLLLPLPLIPFLLFLHATVSVSVSGADPSMSADEEKNDPDFFDLSASESGYCSGDNEYSVLFPLLSWFPVAGSVLLRLHLLRLLVWLSSLLLSPPSISRTKSLMSCRVNLILLLPRVPAAAKADFESAKSSVTKSVVSCFLQVCSCLWKARSCYCKVFWLPVYELGGFPPFWFWLCCIRMSWFSSLLGLWFSLPLHWRSGFDLLWVYDRFVKYVRRQVSRKKASFMRCEFTVFENAADPLPSSRPAKFPGQ